VSRADRQGGFTLIELLMGIVLSSIFALALFGFFFSGVDSARTHESQARAQMDGRQAIDRLSRDIRQAISPNGGVTAPVISLSPTTLELYVDPSRNTSSTTPRPQKVRYTVSSGQLVREAADPVGAVAPFSYGAYTQSEVIVEKVSNGATPLFSAVTEDGIALPASPTASQLRDVAQISLRLLVGQKTGNASTTLELRTDVALRNALTL
jgi:prepilin-type N-terminal cleavage/methylation domain-containing protein